MIRGMSIFSVFPPDPVFFAFFTLLMLGKLSSPMDQILIQSFTQLISHQIGLQTRPQDYPGLSQKILTRCRELRFFDPQDYYNLLKSETPASEKEWERLIPLLTTPESYFFRDRGQFKLLQTVILPQLIERQKRVKKLRIWSAGCSTGEEPYSLSLLLQKLIPNWEEWNLMVLGTDINELSLQKARSGVYSAWSFRQVDSEVISLSFIPCTGGWKINPQAQKLVKFLPFNLVKDSLGGEINVLDFDLILCRNVFVYFEKVSIHKGIQKFYQALKPGGYLMTAHAELQGLEVAPFKAIIFPESVVYQRPLIQEPNLQTSSSNSKLDISDLFFLLSPFQRNTTYPPSSLTSKPHQNLASKEGLIPQKNQFTSLEKYQIKPEKISVELQEAKQLYQQKKYNDAIQKVNTFLNKSSPNFDAYYLLGKIYANLGQYQQATQYCQKAIAVDSLSVLPCYILLNIAEETNNIEEAKKFAKRIIYLSGVSPLSISAYVKLASLYEQEKNHKKAIKIYNVALELLHKLPAKAEVEYTDHITVDELITSLNSIIENLNQDE